MAQTKTRSSGRATGTTRSNGNSPPRSSPRATSARKASRSPSARSRTTAKRSPSSSRSRQNRSRGARSGSSASRQSANGVTGTLTDVGDSIGSAVGKAGDSVGTAAKKAKMPAMVGTAAAAGLAGGIALGARVLSRPKGASAPGRRARALIPGGGGAFRSVAHEMQEVGREIGRAGFRLGVGDVSMEVQKGRSEQRDSPLEVLLNGLTNRRSKRR